MYDPQAIRFLSFLFAAVLYLVVIVVFFYAVYVLAKMRTETVKISRKLDEVLARMSSGSPDSTRPS